MLSLSNTNMYVDSTVMVTGRIESMLPLAITVKQWIGLYNLLAAFFDQRSPWKQMLRCLEYMINLTCINYVITWLPAQLRLTWIKIGANLGGEETEAEGQKSCCQYKHIITQ